MELITKISDAIDKLRNYEKLALRLNPDGYYVGFSGGKDSQVLLDIVKQSGVKFHAHYTPTTNEPAVNIRFIRTYYPDVSFDIPTTSFLREIPKQGLPTRLVRWCCRIFKEERGAGNVVLTGIRREESTSRSKYPELTKRVRRSKDRPTLDFDKMEDNNFQCIQGKDTILFYPILDFTDDDVWTYIHENHMPINPVYQSVHRMGCIYCPFVNRNIILNYAKSNPRLHGAFMSQLSKYVATHDSPFIDADDMFTWWLSGLSIKDYLLSKRQLSLPFEPPTPHAS